MSIAHVSPLREAGFKPGDRVIEFRDGRPLWTGTIIRDFGLSEVRHPRVLVEFDTGAKLPCIIRDLCLADPEAEADRIDAGIDSLADRCRS